MAHNRHFILLLSGRVFYRWPVIRLSWLIVFQVFYILTDFLFILSITERGILKFPIVFVDLSIFPFSFISFCFAYFVAVLIYRHLGLKCLFGGLTFFYHYVMYYL